MVKQKMIWGYNRNTKLIDFEFEYGEFSIPYQIIRWAYFESKNERDKERKEKLIQKHKKR